tara:strand:- start:242 stop:1039 length:798 start_codon:yes stop_codon:yes gene_type:complete
MNASLFPDVVVNGETVPHRMVAAEAQNHTGPRDKPGIAWRKAANAVAVRTLLLQTARQRGMTPDPQEVGPGRFETDEEALIRALLETAVETEAPSDTTVRAEWARDPTRFRTPPLWEVSHILCACDPRDEAAQQLAHTRALALTADALANPGKFSALASRESECGSKTAGGALGQLGPGETVPEFEAALRTLAEGQITAEPVLTRHGWHIIRLDALAEGRVLPFEAVRDKIAEALEKAAWTKAARAFIGRLVGNATISGADFRSV